MLYSCTFFDFVGRPSAAAAEAGTEASPTSEGSECRAALRGRLLSSNENDNVTSIYAMKKDIPSIYQ
jgi:hypothetical protein